MCDPGEKEADVVGQSSKAGRGRPSEMSSTSKTQSPLLPTRHSPIAVPSSRQPLVRSKLNGRSGC